MGSCDFGLVHIRHEVRIITYCDPCEEDLVDCREDVEESDSVIAHEDCADVEEDAEDYVGGHLR